jgi:hypothetical protein
MISTRFVLTSEAPTVMTKAKKAAATPLSDLPALEAAIADFDRTDLLSAVAGLQLLPANAERIIRLEALAYLVASGKPKRSRKVAPHTLTPLCNCEALQTIAHAEDPFDSVFCEEVLFHGGSYKVLPGITEHATFILKRINETIFFHRDAFPDALFVRTATHLIQGTLALSDRMCRLAGVRRNPDLSTSGDRNIFVPNGTRLAELKASVRLSRAALGDFLRSRGHPADCLAPLTVAADELPHENELHLTYHTRTAAIGRLNEEPTVDGFNLADLNP